MSFNRSIVLLLLLCVTAFGGTVTLTSQRPAAIILPASPTVVERTAASELSAYLEKLKLGKSIIITEGNPVPAGRTIFHVGWSKKSASMLKRGADDMKFDESVVKITEKGDILLVGHPTRGTLYAVYDFLETDCGVRWLTPTEESVPLSGRIELTAGERSVVPAFEERTFHGSLAVQAPRFNAKKRRNGDNMTDAEGGSILNSMLCFSHSSDRFVPDAAYFNSHRSYFGPDEKAPNPPQEYFALRNGRRIAGTEGQPCHTHPDVPAYAAEYMARLLRRKEGNWKTIWLTQNDNAEYCMCDRCVAAEKRLGNRADLNIDFVNKVAAILDKEFPGIQVATFAYQFTMEPPKTIRPAHNVHVRVCLIEADAYKPFTHPANERFGKIIRGWCEISSNVSIWHYTTNFTNFGLVHPTTRAITENYRFFKKLGIKSIFTQDDADSGRFAWFMAYRTYLANALMVNPDRDADEIQKEFFRGYYGPAAEEMMAVMNFFEDKAAETPTFVTCYQFDTSMWLEWQALKQGDELLRKAEAAAAKDPAAAARVAEIRASLDWTRLWRHENTALAKISGFTPSHADREWLAAKRITVPQDVAKFNPTSGWKRLYTRMGTPLDNHITMLNGFLDQEPPHMNLPAELANVPAKDLIIIPSSRFSVATGKLNIPDYKGKGWLSTRLIFNGYIWAMRVDIPAMKDASEWEVLFEARHSNDTRNPQGIFAYGGVYFYGTNFAEKTSFPLKGEDFTSEKYTLHSLGTTDFKRATQIYFAANNNATVPELLIGRIFLKRK